jgi:hypothetical protein
VGALNLSPPMPKGLPKIEALATEKATELENLRRLNLGRELDRAAMEAKLKMAIKR